MNNTQATHTAQKLHALLSSEKEYYSEIYKSVDALVTRAFQQALLTIQSQMHHYLQSKHII
jgi:hypothetical protein